MKDLRYCAACGQALEDGAIFCPNCGTRAVTDEAPAEAKKENAIDLLIKVFMIIGTVSSCWTLIPLAWCIPMTVVLFRKMKNGEPTGMAFNICVLLFVNLVAGILLILKDEGLD